VTLVAGTKPGRYKFLPDGRVSMWSMRGTMTCPCICASVADRD